MTYLIVQLCVLGIAAGQILFKLSAMTLHRTGSWLDPATLFYFLIALALYGITTLAWVWVLQKVELGKVYPFMAMAFVLVPLGSHFIFDEKFQVQYFVGVAFIIAGILIAIRS